MTESYSDTAATPEAGARAGPAGSVKETVTLNVSEVCVAPSALTTRLVGDVVSISHVVESEPEPAWPAASWMPSALTVSVYWPWAVVSPARPPICVGRARDRADGHRIGDQVRAAVQAQGHVVPVEGGQVDRLVERDIQGGDRRLRGLATAEKEVACGAVAASDVPS